MIFSPLFAVKLTDFVDKTRCNQIIDKEIYAVCYSYKYKGALFGWTVLEGDNVNAVNIKKRERFYNEKTIPIKYRTKYKDYTGYGKKWNRGHFIISDADADYDRKILKKTYSMCNIQPQSAKLNQRTWIKVERYGRMLATKFGYITSISISNYIDAKNKIGNNIVIPSGFYRIYYNNENNFKKCFYYKNVLDIDYKKDKLKNHIIDCADIKY